MVHSSNSPLTYDTTSNLTSDGTIHTVDTISNNSIYNIDADSTFSSNDSSRIKSLIILSVILSLLSTICSIVVLLVTRDRKEYHEGNITYHNHYHIGDAEFWESEDYFANAEWECHFIVRAFPRGYIRYPAWCFNPGHSAFRSLGLLESSVLFWLATERSRVLWSCATLTCVTSQLKQLF